MARSGSGKGDGGGKRCSLCGASGLPQDAQRCTACGRSLTKKCGGCQTENEAAARHCKICGVAFPVPGARTRVARVPPVPKSPWRVTVDCVPDDNEWNDNYEFHIKVTKDGVATSGHLLISGVDTNRGDKFSLSSGNGVSLSDITTNSSGVAVVKVNVATGGGRTVVFRLHESELDKEIKFKLKGPRFQMSPSGDWRQAYKERKQFFRG